MTRAASDRPHTVPFSTLPIRIEATTGRLHAAGRALAIATLVGLASVSVAGIAYAASETPAVLMLLAERPLAALQTAIGMVLCGALLFLPVKRLASHALRRREVLIENGIVEIVDRTPLGERRRTVPLAAYRGVAHHIKASLSGLTHEVVLVHAEPALTVTLFQAEKVTQATIDDAKRLLGLPEVPARAMYEKVTEAGAGPAAAAAPVRA